VTEETDRPKVFRHPALVTEHVFDKLRSIDLGQQEEERILTVYEPDPTRWDARFRRRR